MALRIFETDPDAQKAQNTGGDIVARFRSGYLDGKNPKALSEWRVTTGDPEVADAIANLLGGDPTEWDTESEEALEVFTDAKSVEVILSGTDALRSEMILWGRNGMVRRCDGITQMGTEADDPAKGEDCECPMSFKDRQEAAKKGKGCGVSITLYFSLADLPDLGKVKFQSGSWSFAKDLPKLEKALEKADGPVRATLELETIETKAGRTFTKPKVTILGPAES